MTENLVAEFRGVARVNRGHPLQHRHAAGRRDEPLDDDGRVVRRGFITKGNERAVRHGQSGMR